MVMNTHTDLRCERQYRQRLQQKRQTVLRHRYKEHRVDSTYVRESKAPDHNNLLHFRYIYGVDMLVSGTRTCTHYHDSVETAVRSTRSMCALLNASCSATSLPRRSPRFCACLLLKAHGLDADWRQLSPVRTAQ